MKKLTINGIVFEVVNSKKYPTTVESVNRYMDRFTGRSLWDCYDRPSEIKESIWDNWRYWMHDSNVNENEYSVQYMQVSSYNSMMFTIDALVFDKQDYIKYFLHITPTHNYAYPVVTEQYCFTVTGTRYRFRCGNSATHERSVT